MENGCIHMRLQNVAARKMAANDGCRPDDVVEGWMIRDVRWSAGLLLLFPPLFILGAIAGHFVPPPSPSSSPAAVAALYHASAGGAAFFALVNNICTMTWIPAVAVQTILMVRMRPHSYLLALIFFLSASIAIIAPFLATIFILGASLRTGLSPETLAILSDLGFMMTGATTLPSLLQGGALGTAILRDRSAPPVLPYWLGWFNIVYGVAVQFNLISYFVPGGPFAADGLIGGGLPILFVLCWPVLTAVALFGVREDVWQAADSA